ncbi:MAG TPA: beta-galactosidase, partial [Thermomicrobiales bacterium]|nr:beta-galactosidase [Thermomicrobiales bacterium]
MPRLPGSGPPVWLLILAGLAGRLDRSRDGVRVVRALLAAVAGLALALGGALADTTLHRGVESGAERPVVRHATGRDLATNVDLTRFAPEQVPQVAAALQANGFRYVRQSFAWADIEPAPGQFAWERYDAIVGELSRRGIA